MSTNGLELQNPKPPKKRKSTSFYISLATVIMLLALWYIVTKFRLVSPMFLPEPQKVWAAFISICTEGYKSYAFWEHLSASLERIGLAFGLATLVAVPLGLASGYIPWIKAIMEPVVEFIRPLPPLAYYTLLVLWMGIDNESKVMLLFIACFMPIYIACATAVLRVSQNYLRNAAVLGANRFQIFFRIIFPSALPDIFLSMRTALGFGYTTLVAAEMVAARSGIGWMVLDASNYLKSEVVFVGIIIMSMTGLLLDQFIRMLKNICIPWEGKDI